MQAKRNNRSTPPCSPAQGFSLLEMLVVLALLALLMRIALPSYQDSVRRAKRTEAWASMMKAMQQQERHYSLHGTYVAFSAKQANGFHWYSGSSPANSAYELSAAACDKHTLKQCVILTARPGTGRVQSGYTDAACGTITLNSAGVRSASGNGAQCW